MKKTPSAARLFLAVAAAAAVMFSCRTTSVPEKIGPDQGYAERPEDGDVSVYNNVGDYLEKGDTASAVAEFEKLGLDDPESRIAYAGLLVSAGEVSKAEAILAGVLESDPDNPEAMFNMALVEIMKGDTESGTDLLERVVLIEPSHAGALSARGSLFLSEGKLRKAESYLRRALESDPDNIMALTGLGNTLIRTEKYEEAEEILDRAVALDPEDAFTYLDRSNARLALGNKEGAEADMSEAVRIEPDYFWHYLDRGRLRLREIGDRSGALEDFNRASELDPGNFYPYVFRAGIYDETGMLEEALADYRKVLELKPEYYFAHSSMGVIYMILEDWEASRISFEAAFKSEPDVYSHLLMAAVSVMRQGDRARTLKYCRTLMDKVPSSEIHYHILRSFTETGYDSYVLRMIQEEKDAGTRKRLLFYIAELYHQNGMESAAYSYFATVRDAGISGAPECRIAAAELEKHYE